MMEQLKVGTFYSYFLSLSVTPSLSLVFSSFVLCCRLGNGNFFVLRALFSGEGVCVCVCVYVSMCMYVYVCMYVRACVCVCVLCAWMVCIVNERMYLSMHVCVRL